MRPQDIDSRGNVAMLDTVTDEVKHRPVHLAQEILTRNPPGEDGEARYQVLSRDTPEASANPEKRRLQVAQERKVASFEGEGGGQIVHSDATDLYSGRHSSPVALPAADSPPVAVEREGDPEKVKAQAKLDKDARAEAVKANEDRANS